MASRKGGHDIVRSGPADDRLAGDERASPSVRRGVASSERTVPEVVPLRARTIWLITAIVGGLAAGWVVVGHSLEVWELLFIGIVLAEGLRPLVAGLHARRLPRPLAVLLLYGVVLIVVGLLGRLLLTPLVAQAAAFVAALPRYVAQAQHQLGADQRFLGRTPQAATALNPLIVLVAILAGGSLRGLVGAVLAVPVAVVLEVIVLGILTPAARRASAATDTAAPVRGVPRPTAPGDTPAGA